MEYMLISVVVTQFSVLKYEVLIRAFYSFPDETFVLWICKEYLVNDEFNEQMMPWQQSKTHSFLFKDCTIQLKSLDKIDKHGKNHGSWFGRKWIFTRHCTLSTEKGEHLH